MLALPRVPTVLKVSLAKSELPLEMLNRGHRSPEVLWVWGESMGM